MEESNMKTKWKRTLLTLVLTTALMLSASTSALAVEANGEVFVAETMEDAAVQPRAMTTIKEFSGDYYMGIDVPFTITDSSTVVKVMYAVIYVDHEEMTSSVCVKNSSGKVIWYKNNLSGEKQILEIGKLPVGNYTFSFLPGNLAKKYGISGKLYYFSY